MFKSIQVTSGYSIFKMNSDGPIGVNKKNEGTISALLKMGGRVSAPFGGFIEAGNIVGLKKVKLLDIKYLCVDDEAETIEYVLQNDHYLVGTYKDGRLYILLFEGKPKHHQIKGFDQDRTNNVIGLF